MNYSIYGYDIATKNKYYHGPETLQIDEIDKLQDQSTLETPNMSVSPDGRYVRIHLLRFQ
jgi:Tol biopolymer transport system component